MKTFSEIGLLSAGLASAPQSAIAEATDDPTKDVPRVGGWVHTNHEEVLNGKPPEREPMVYTISRAKWAEVESAHDAAEKVSNQLHTLGLGVTCPVGVTTDTVHGSRRKVVDVRYDASLEDKTGLTAAELSDKLPNKMSGVAGSGSNAVQVDGIPVRVSKEEVTPAVDTSGGNYYDDKYRPVPGGAAVTTDNCNLCYPGETHGTVATPAWSNDLGDYVMVTCGHLTEGDTGQTVNQPGPGGDEFGITNKVENDDSGVSFDAATIDMDTKWGDMGAIYSFAADPNDAYNGGSNYDQAIGGIRSYIWCKDHEGDTSVDLTKRGKTTGYDDGGYLTWVGTKNGDKIIKTNHWVYDGDSGGPVYHWDGDWGYICGVVGYNANPNNDGDPDLNVYSTAMEAIETRFSITV